jgi:hypothetical protein
MARYTNKICTSVAPSSLAPAIEKYLSKNEFYQVSYKGNAAWRKGKGIIAGPQFIILTYGEQKITIEAFLKLSLIPGIFVGEMDTEGYINAVPKRILKESINALEQFIKSL